MSSLANPSTAASCRRKPKITVYDEDPTIALNTAEDNVPITGSGVVGEIIKGSIIDNLITVVDGYRKGVIAVSDAKAYIREIFKRNDTVAQKHFSYPDLLEEVKTKFEETENIHFEDAVLDDEVIALVQANIKARIEKVDTFDDFNNVDFEEYLGPSSGSKRKPSVDMYDNPNKVPNTAIEDLFSPDNVHDPVTGTTTNKITGQVAINENLVDIAPTDISGIDALKDAGGAVGNVAFGATLLADIGTALVTGQSTDKARVAIDIGIAAVGGFTFNALELGALVGTSGGIGFAVVALIAMYEGFKRLTTAIQRAEEQADMTPDQKLLENNVLNALSTNMDPQLQAEYDKIRQGYKMDGKHSGQYFGRYLVGLQSLQKRCAYVGNAIIAKKRADDIAKTLDNYKDSRMQYALYKIPFIDKAKTISNGYVTISDEYIMTFVQQLLANYTYVSNGTYMWGDGHTYRYAQDLTPGVSMITVDSNTDMNQAIKELLGNVYQTPTLEMYQQFNVQPPTVQPSQTIRIKSESKTQDQKNSCIIS